MKKTRGKKSRANVPLIKKNCMRKAERLVNAMPGTRADVPLTEPSTQLMSIVWLWLLSLFWMSTLIFKCVLCTSSVLRSLGRNWPLSDVKYLWHDMTAKNFLLKVIVSWHFLCLFCIKPLLLVLIDTIKSYFGVYKIYIVELLILKSDSLVCIPHRGVELSSVVRFLMIVPLKAMAST